MENQERKIQEIQILEQNLQNLLLQKQAFNMELSETKSAKKEIENAGDDVFKIIGQLMIKSDKLRVGAELSNKERLLELRVKSLEKQEILLTEKIDSIRKEFF
ncbi:MAG: prefoldin subunit [Nanoarchaeota archaeon]